MNFKKIGYEDIDNKVRWYNDKEITKFLHYEEKFTISGTENWLDNILHDESRYENVIQVIDDNKYYDIGIIGLFNIDFKNKKAGFYITIGEKSFQGKGLSKPITNQFLEHSFEKFDLEKIFLFTDENNIKAINLYETIGFKREGFLRHELLHDGEFINRYYYGILKNEFYNSYKREG